MSDQVDHECTDGDRYYGRREECAFCSSAAVLPVEDDEQRLGWRTI